MAAQGCVDLERSWEKMKQAIRVVLAVVLLAALTGCAGRYVRTSTGSAGQTKFLYTQGSKTGVVKCDTDDATGALSNCRLMTINYEK